jgi:hypothetical protein
MSVDVEVAEAAARAANSASDSTDMNVPVVFTFSSVFVCQQLPLVPV